MDDLNAPLGQNIPEKQRTALSVSRRRMIAAGVAMLLVGAAIGALLALYHPVKQAASSKTADPDKVGPERTGSIPESRPAEIVRPAVAPPAPPSQPDKTEPPATQTITIIDGTSGKREQIVVPLAPQSAR